MPAKKPDPMTPAQRVEAVVVLAHTLGLHDVEERLRVTQGIPDLVAEVVAIYEAAVALAEELAEPAEGAERGLKLARAAMKAAVALAGG